MEVHVGRNHCETFDCGLCDFVAKDIETLDLNLFTCEFYECYACNKRFKTLTNLKTHFQEEHGVKSHFTVTHAKLNRKNSEVVDEKDYNNEELFPEMNGK